MSDHAALDHDDHIVVLLVEDEELIRLAACDALQDAGFNVHEAATADEAVTILERRADIQIIFSDIDMPGSMNGLKLAAAVRGRWPPIEILLTSGYLRIARKELPTRCIFIPKPYKAAEVVTMLRKMCA